MACCAGPVAAQCVMAGASVAEAAPLMENRKQPQEGDVGVHVKATPPSDITSAHEAPPPKGSGW